MFRASTTRPHERAHADRNPDSFSDIRARATPGVELGPQEQAALPAACADTFAAPPPGPRPRDLPRARGSERTNLHGS